MGARGLPWPAALLPAPSLSSRSGRLPAACRPISPAQEGRHPTRLGGAAPQPAAAALTSTLCAALLAPRHRSGLASWPPAGAQEGPHTHSTSWSAGRHTPPAPKQRAAGSEALPRDVDDSTTRIRPPSRPGGPTWGRGTRPRRPAPAAALGPNTSRIAAPGGRKCGEYGKQCRAQAHLPRRRRRRRRRQRGASRRLTDRPVYSPLFGALGLRGTPLHAP